MSNGLINHSSLQSCSCAAATSSLLLLALLAVGPAALAQGREPKSRFDRFSERTVKLTARVQALRKRLAKTIRKIEKTRSRARKQQLSASKRPAPKKKPKWSIGWQKGKRQRKLLHSSFTQLLRPWHGELKSLLANRTAQVKEATLSAKLPELCLRVLQIWIEVGEPETILDDLHLRYPAIRTVLSCLEDKGLRPGMSPPDCEPHRHHAWAN